TLSLSTPAPHSFPTRRSSDLCHSRSGHNSHNSRDRPSLRLLAPLSDTISNRDGGLRIECYLSRSQWKFRLDSTARPAATSSSKRSEEHTSELQSRSDLVCRLL